MPLSVIALVGPRAAGKSTLAGALARALGWPAVDTDLVLGERVGRPAGEFLADAGEPAFRRIEEAVCLDALGRGSPRVVAMGGGAVLSAAVRRRLVDADVLTVLLEAELSDLVARQRASASSRPPLTALSLEDEVAALLAGRRSHYEQVARMRVNTSTSNVDACVASIWCKMRASQRGPE